jgi:hypothetical protein
VEQSAATSAILLDGAEILCDLVLDEPWHARRLLEPGAVSYCTDDQMAMDRSVFEPLGDGRYRIRFRYDEGLLMEDWARSSVEHLREGYVSNSRYATRVPLDVGHILLVDNQRMLMAFDEGPSDAQRLLRRLWIALDDQAILVPARGKGRPQPALRHYEAYQPLNEDRTRRNTGRLKLGIRVPPELSTTIAGLSESVLH